MKIAVDANELTLRENTGVKVYEEEILKALSGIDKNNQYILYSSAPLRQVYGGNFENRAVKSALPFWTYTMLAGALKKDRPDALFMPIQSTPFFRKPEGMKLAITVHDMAFLPYPEYFTFKDRYLLDYHTRRAAEMADAIIVPSEATKKDLEKYYSIERKKMKTIYHGTNRNLGSGESSYYPDLRKNYILFVGTIQPRKNIVNLIRAFEILKGRARMRPDLKLVICGNDGWMKEGTHRAAQESKYYRNIIFTGRVNNEQLAELYRNALLFALPSLYEGFGLPVLEAMSFGLPCVVSNNSSLREIAGDAALQTEPNDVSDIANKMEMILENGKLSAEYKERSIANARKYDWKKSAQMHLDVLEGLK